MYVKFSLNFFLYYEVKLRGGDDWLLICRYIGDKRNKWEGDGVVSDYIVCLIEVFIRIDCVMINRLYYC